MDTITLNGTWDLSFGPQTKDAPETPAALATADWQTIPAHVPGNVELDLMREGALPPLAVGTNVYALRAFETYRWWYCRHFEAPLVEAGERLALTFAGLDCVATVWVNGQEVGRASNALVAHSFDITDAVTPGLKNAVHVRIDSPTLHARDRLPEAVECTPAGPSHWESLAVRKPPHAYGWDILPRIVSAGLWRDVTLQVVKPTRLRSVTWFTESVNRESGAARVGVDWDFCTDRLLTDAWSVKVSLANEAGEVIATSSPAFYTHGRFTLDLEEADLWWPRGYGNASLYQALVELVDEKGEVLDRHACAVGVRTVELDMTPTLDADGNGAFRFVVNGHPVFAKGTNWVALDALHSRDRDHYKAVLPMLADLNCNMVRCWGGSVYEEECFYAFCDREGIMVWQDFCFACAAYPQDSRFAEAVYEEAVQVVRRLRNHPALVLWAGNNENDIMLSWVGRQGTQDPNADRVSRSVLAEAVRRNDPTRPYLPSSPYVSPECQALGAPESAMPEQHLWGARPFYKSAYYAECRAHFVSEIGYHGCPGRETLEQMLTPAGLWPPEGNREWTAKAVAWHPDDTAHEARITLMTNQLKHLFNSSPDGLDDTILASQLTQMEALKFFVEHWRMRKHRGGLLWWNLRDGWPVISDAVVDYYNRPKLAYEVLKRVQADVCLMGGEPHEGAHPLIGINDTREPTQGALHVHNTGGQEILASPFTLEPGRPTDLGRLPTVRANDLYLMTWQLADGTVGRNHYLCGPLPMDLAVYRALLPWLDLPDAGEHL